MATLICAVLPEESAQLAKFMCHSVGQQQGTYNELLTISKSVRMSNIVSKILTGDNLQMADFDAAVLGKILDTFL